jgi:hypothetical protein
MEKQKSNKSINREFKTGVAASLTKQDAPVFYGK